MASELLSKWLTHYDPIHRGYTPRGIANGVSATLGWSFPRVAGGYNLYRTGSDQPVGAAGANATGVSNFSWRPHAANTTYDYELRSVGGGGVESASSSPILAEFSAGGDLVGPRPPSPMSVDVKAVAGGRFVVSWVMDDRFAEERPIGFLIYHDSGTGNVNFAFPIGGTTYRRGRVHYAFTSVAFSHGLRMRWGVRAVTAEGVTDENVLTALGVADAEAPSAVDAVGLVCLDEE